MAKTKKKRNDLFFPYPIRIVNLCPALPLYSKGLLEKALQTGNIFQHTNKPNQPVFVTRSLEAQGLLGYDCEQTIFYIQIFGSDFVDCSRNKNGNSYFPNRLYQKVLALKNKKEFQLFLEKYKFFTIFPTVSDAEELHKKYVQAGIPDIPIHEYLYKKGEKPEHLLINTTKKQHLAIIKINNDYLWEKIQAFQDIARMFSNGSLEEHKLLWINDQMENVSPVMTAYDGALWKWVVGKKPFFNLDETVGMRRVRPLHPIMGYRVYGTFAYCCWEFFMDMERDSTLFLCKNCTTIRFKQSGENRKYCSKEESSKCFSERQNQRKQRERLSK